MKMPLQQQSLQMPLQQQQQQAQSQPVAAGRVTRSASGKNYLRGISNDFVATFGLSCTPINSAKHIWIFLWKLFVFLSVFFLSLLVNIY